MTLLSWVVKHIAPVFIVTSPVTSYADQIWSISKTRSSKGFSLDIPLIMLVSSILKYGFPYSHSIPVNLYTYNTCMSLTPRNQALLLVWRPLRHAPPDPSGQHDSRPATAAARRPAAPPHRPQPQQTLRRLKRRRRHQHAPLQLLAMAPPPPLLGLPRLLHPHARHLASPHRLQRLLHRAARLRGAGRRSRAAFAADHGERAHAQLQRV